MQQNIHTGHRKRIRERLLSEGIDHFSEHQILEILLFYAIPVKDTNEIAHNLIKKFSSLSGILEADPKKLMEVEGVGENCATLITLIPQLSRRYLKSKWEIDKYVIKDSIAAEEYIKSLFIGHTNEVFYLICLNSQLKLTGTELIFEGTINESAIYPRAVVESALRHQATSVILAHNHPGGSINPSQADINVTLSLKNALEPILIKINDHFIVAGNEIFSFAQNGIIQ